MQSSTETAAQSQGQGSTNILVTFAPYALIIAIFYFLLIAPARKKQKLHQQMLDSLKTGDRVITSGGIYGTIVKVNKEDDSLRLRIAPSVEIDVTRASVSGMQPEPQPGT